MRRLNIRQLCDASGMSRATVYRLIAMGKLPKPEKRDGTASWNARDVREALAHLHRLLLA